MKNTKKAFQWIIKILEENNIKYRISGGLAAQVYGSKRELADIDIEVLEKDINKIYKKVKDFVIYGPAIYKDENWNLMLMTLKFQDQEIDIAAFEAKIFNSKTKRWIKKPGKLSDADFKNIFNINVPVEKIDSLIKYKKILTRDVDIKDVQQLKKTNMKSVKNIDEYILSFPLDIQEKLNDIRGLVKKIIPQAEEAIKYGMPTFILNDNLLHFAAFKKHIGLYPTPSAIIKFKKELVKYSTSKGAIQFSLDEPLPMNLITKIIKFRATENELNFSQKVYKVVCKIPEGKVLTYKQVAEKVGRPLAYRAVGNILNKNHNKNIPCHRVIKSNGEIGGYNRGSKLKKQILKKEGVVK